MQIEPWRQAADVVSKSVGYRLARRHDPRAPVGWHVVNLTRQGRNFRYRVTTNTAPEGTDQLWVINLHGYFAGGSMYARESEVLAREFGWRVVNPSLPGFGGSDPLEMAELSLDALVDYVDIVREDLGIGRCLVLGHSMGGAVAIAFAARHPEDVLGVIYRDGVATPEWTQRRGLVAKVVNPLFPDMAPVIDIWAAVALDLPDLLFGHFATTVKALWPDLKTNAKTVAQSMPVASLLFELDLTATVRAVAEQGIPIYPIWGCIDRVVPGDAAAGFARASGAAVQWVPGGHSWMLARPSAQKDLLCAVPSGQTFREAFERRRVETGRATHLRRVV
jgi:pimeloyl-ACP methyl ester carboxylesterase